MYRRYFVDDLREHREDFLVKLRRQNPTKEQLERIKNGELVVVGEHSFEIENLNGI